MNFIYVANRNDYTTEEFIRKIAAEKLNITNVVIVRNEHGRPYFLPATGQETWHFSLSHTGETLFAVFSKRQIGLDAEEKRRSVDFQKLVKRVDDEFCVSSCLEFLQLWTAKESVVKFLGESLATSVKKIEFSPTFDKVRYAQKPLPVRITHLYYGDFLLAVCAEELDEYSFCVMS